MAARALRAWALPISFMALALLFGWPLTLHPNWVPVSPLSPYTDLLISHLPNAEYLRTAVWQLGQWPWWNTQHFTGQPFAADPLAGMWYPPNGLLLILPLPLGFNVLLVGHLAWGGYGLYRWLRVEGLRAGAAFLAGLAFVGTPKLIAHIAGGHVSLVMAVTWTPWWLWQIAAAFQPATPTLGKRWLAAGAQAGAVLALVALADVRWAFYAGLLGVAYFLWRAWNTTPVPTIAQLAGFGLTTSLLTFLLAAPLLVPLLEFLNHSQRHALSLAEAGVYSLPGPFLLGLVAPLPALFAGARFHEYVTYAGVVPFLLAVAGVRRQTWFWLGVVGGAVAFALGRNFVLFPLLFGLLPGLSFLRVPSRAWFLVVFGLVVLAAHGAQRLMAQRPAQAQRLLGSFAVVTAAELLFVNAFLLTAAPRPALNAAAEWLRAQPGDFRVYSPSYSLPPGDGLRHLDGINPLQLAASTARIEQAIGVRATKYSVTVPAFEAEDVALAVMHQNAILDPARLGQFAVRYVVAEFPISAPQLQLVQTFGATQIYENLVRAPWVWWQIPQPAATLELTSQTPNRLVLKVQTATTNQLILSEAAYPGWQAWVDGSPVPVIAADGVFRSVAVPAGAHEVVLEFWPVSVGVGLLLAVVGLSLLLGVWRWAK